jgi:hypothetical protein
MAETLGSLCDKLTVVKLKQWHADDPAMQKSLAVQEKQLQDEIGDFLAGAVAGSIPADRLTFAANKVYRKEGNSVPEVVGSIGEVFGRLADVNCRLWHEQERVYEFEKVPHGEKDHVIRNLASLNLERTRCIDQLDTVFRSLIQNARTEHGTF